MQTLSTKERLDYEAKARSEAEAARHHRAMEGVASGNLAVARGNLGVRQNALKVMQGKTGGKLLPGNDDLGKYMTGGSEGGDMLPFITE
jgi:hypothetical protein